MPFWKNLGDTIGGGRVKIGRRGSWRYVANFGANRWRDGGSGNSRSSSRDTTKTRNLGIMYDSTTKSDMHARKNEQRQKHIQANHSKGNVWSDKRMAVTVYHDNESWDTR